MMKNIIFSCEKHSTIEVSIMKSLQQLILEHNRQFVELGEPKK